MHSAHKHQFKRLFEKYFTVTLDSFRSPLTPLKKGGTGIKAPLKKGGWGSYKGRYFVFGHFLTILADA